MLFRAASSQPPVWRRSAAINSAADWARSAATVAAPQRNDQHYPAGHHARENDTKQSIEMVEPVLERGDLVATAYVRRRR